jgi:splicing factor 3B subunit 1
LSPSGAIYISFDSVSGGENALAALAEAASPYGIELFDDILNPLWTEARQQRGKAIASFLEAVGYVIPLMDEKYLNY